MFKCECCGEEFNYEDEMVFLDCNGISMSIDEVDGVNLEMIICCLCYENDEHIIKNPNQNNTIRCVSCEYFDMCELQEYEGEEGFYCNNFKEFKTKKEC